MLNINKSIAYALFVALQSINVLYAKPLKKIENQTDNLIINPVTDSKNSPQNDLDLSLYATFLSPIKTNKTDRLHYEYVGGRTRIGVGIDTEFDATAEIRHFFKDQKNKTQSTEAWLGLGLTGSDKGINAGGIKFNNHWVKFNKYKKPLVIKKSFIAYDRNVQGDDKLTIGYGQEIKKRFWEVSVGKGLSDKRSIGNTNNGQVLFEKAYDLTIGGQYGLFRPQTNTRWRGGVDYSWGDAEGTNESNPSQLGVSLNVEKFFKKTPHSVALDLSVVANKGGFDNKDTDTRANLTYRYEFNKKKSALSLYSVDHPNAWVKRALYNPIKHSRYVGTFRTQSANGQPIAVADGTFVIGAPVPLTIDVLSNDTDPNGDTLTITGVTQPSNGSASIVNGQILYTPNPGSSGLVTFTYTISDGNGGSSTASISVQIVTP